MIRQLALIATSLELISSSAAAAAAAAPYLLEGAAEAAGEPFLGGGKRLLRGCRGNGDRIGSSQPRSGPNRLE